MTESGYIQKGLLFSVVFIILLFQLMSYVSHSHKTFDGLNDFRHTVMGYKVYADREIKTWYGANEDRKRLRWVYKKFEVSLFGFFEKHFGLNGLMAFYLLHLTLYLTGTVYFIYAFVSQNTKTGALSLALISLGFIAYIQYILGWRGGEIDFSIKETFWICACMYFSLKRKILAFIICVAVCVSIRETGVLLSFFYPFFNHRDFKNYCFLALGPILLCLYNYDLLSNENFYRPDFFNSQNLDHSHITLVNANDLPPVRMMTSLTSHSILFLPLIFLFFTRIQFSENLLKVTTMLVAYTIVVYAGSPLSDYTSRMLLVPFIITLLCMAHSAKAKDSQSPSPS